jgi:hypothetical protein
MSPILEFSGLKDFFRDSVPDYTLAREPIHRSKTPHTTTVFSGEPEEWISYLKTPWDQRRNHPLELDVEIDKATHTLKFHASNSDSKVWAKLLNEGIKLIRKHLESTPTALEVFEELIFENPTNCSHPPICGGTHESRRQKSFRSAETRNSLAGVASGGLETGVFQLPQGPLPGPDCAHQQSEFCHHSAPV